MTVKHTLEIYYDSNKFFSPKEKSMPKFMMYTESLYPTWERSKCLFSYVVEIMVWIAIFQPPFSFILLHECFKGNKGCEIKNDQVHFGSIAIGLLACRSASSANTVVIKARQIQHYVLELNWFDTGCNW